MQKIKHFILAILLLVSLQLQAQNSSSGSDSPFSRYGIGNINPTWLPQQTGMGGLSTALGPLNPSLINVNNPASYSNNYLATIDAGLQVAYTQNSSSNRSTSNKLNGSLSYVTFAFPVTSQIFKSGMSFGLVPYSTVGYRFSQSSTVGEVTVLSGSYGDGGINRVYAGYGAKIGDNFSIGANVDYYFGNFSNSNTSEFNNIGTSSSAISSKVQNKTYANGLGMSYGIQYDVLISRKTRLALGYAGKLNSQLSFKNEQIATRFSRDTEGNESNALDTLFVNKSTNSLNIPLSHSVGAVLQEDNHWLVGVDYRMSDWSKSSYGNTTFTQSWGVSVGGQWTPNINAISGYLNKIEYRLGYSYDKMNYMANNQPVALSKVTAGLGLPLAPSRLGSYKLNIAFEYGTRGAIQTNGLKEQFYGIQLGFVLNDRWFQKLRFD